jgi:RNA polymerase sigma factor FliA
MLYAPIEHDQLTYRRGRAQQDADALVKAHTASVRRIAWHVHSRMSTAIEVADLMQIGMIALIEAARTFEDRGIAFGPYASTRIRGAMIDQLRRDARMCRSGMSNRRTLAKVRSGLQDTLHRQPSDSEMAVAMDMDLATYHATVKSAQSVQQDSLDEVYSDHELWFADAAESADTQLEKKELKAALAANITKLSEREALILQLYFVEELNLDEIGLTLNVGAARVCQIKKSALEKLRDTMSEWGHA